MTFRSPARARRRSTRGITLWLVALALAAAGWIRVSWVVVSAAGAPARAQGVRTPAPATTDAAPSRALLDRYCVTCHNDRARTGGLSLEHRDLDRIGDAAEIWERVVRKMRTQTMPPMGLPRPDQAGYDSTASFLETALDAAAAAHPNPGRPTVHRLNRAEYTNAIRDLFALDVDGRTLLPPDESGYGFDNIADALSLSPSLLDRYLSTARTISRAAVGDLAMTPAVTTYKPARNLVQHERMSEDLGFGTQGGLAVRHEFPLDAEYLFKVRLQKNFSEVIRGLIAGYQMEIRLDGARLKLFEIGGAEWKAAVKAGKRADYEQIADDGLELRVPVPAGPHMVAVAFLRRTNAEPEGVRPPRWPVESFTYGTEGDEEGAFPSVDTLQIGGPYNPTGIGDRPSRRRIFVCRPSTPETEDACARRILTTLARRAYRRPPAERDVQTLVGFYRTGRTGGDFDAGIRLALERVLISPSFLFRIEQGPAGSVSGTYRLGDVDLASRMSFFFWSSIPDDELLDLAAKGRLKEPAVLEQQVRRMLGDPRAKALVTNFVGQWLHLRNLPSATPDKNEFPEFDENMREAFQRETELFVESQLREDRPVAELLTANYTFLNERLAKHYQIPHVYGNHFRRVTLTDPRRFGLLGQASILTVTSYANRTSPTLRGKFVLDTFLGAPPPAPPPNVPALTEGGEGERVLSVRQRLEQHRRNPACAVCHSRMDPLGFALDNYDALGRWRIVNEAKEPIDASGVLPDGTKVQSAEQLRMWLVTHRNQVVTAVTEKLLIYALGRGIEYYDAPAVRTVVREAGPEYRWSSILLGIVKSTPFRMRRSES